MFLADENVDAMIYQFTVGFIWDLIPREKVFLEKKDDDAGRLEFGDEAVIARVVKTKKKTTTKKSSLIGNKKKMKAKAATVKTMKKKPSKAS